MKPDLSKLTDAELFSEIQRRRSAKRTHHRGGPAPQPTPCRRCHVMCPSARAAWRHCSKKRG